MKKAGDGVVRRRSTREYALLMKSCQPAYMTHVAERYGDQIFNHTTETEDERLGALTAELDTVSFQRLRSMSPRPNWRCLELGAGTGTVARWLADRCPDGTVTATDL